MQFHFFILLFLTNLQHQVVIFVRSTKPFNMTTIVAHPEKDQLETIKAILNALKIPFEEKNQESLPDYVVKGLKASQIQFAEGKTTTYTTVDKLLGFN